MPVTVGGVSLDSLVWNVTTRSDRVSTAGRRGQNIERAGLDGRSWWPGKPLDELEFDLKMWIQGSDPFGELPTVPLARRKVAARYDRLLRVMAQQVGLVEIVDTEAQRRCFGEVAGAVSPDIMAGGNRAEVKFPVTVPAGCWEDVTAFDTGAAVVLPAAGNVTVVGGGGGTLPLLGLTITLTPPASNVVITTSDGHWVQFAGALPVGAATVLDLNADDPNAYQVSSPGVSLLSKVTWDSVAPLPIPVGSGADPVLAVTAASTTGASRIRIQGRRRWMSA
jgi:hypothetical protein